MRMKRRILSLLLCWAMLFSLCSQSVFAEASAQTDSGVTIGESGLCEHHTEHDGECGYSEETAGTPCAHEHTNDCYTEVTECVHEHTDECYPAESVSGNTATPSEAEEAEPTECTHVCSEESGCVTRKLNCQHEHNEDCGYSPATEGTPCGYVCEICGAEGNAKTATPSNAEDVTVASVQAMIDALPNAEEITEDNAEEVKAQLDAIDEAKAQLSDEELDQLDFSLYTEAASALGGLAKPMLTDSTKKISVRWLEKNCDIKDSVSDGVSTAYGTTHTLTVTPQTGRYVIAGYFAGTDYYKTNPAKYQYSNMTLDKISKADPQTGAVQYQFTATEVIPISNDPNYDYICLYFHCAKLPTLLWPFGNISGEATAPSTDGNTAAIPYVSQNELCGDPNGYTGYYSLADKKDRPYLEWQVISITDKKGNTAGGTVAFDNNHLTYTPTANEAGKTITITIRPKLGYVEEANTPLSFEIEVKKPVVEQSEFNVTMVTDGYGNAVAMPNSAKEGEEIQLTAIPDRGHHFKEWQATSGNIMITNDKFTMPAGNVTVKAIFEANTYTVKLDANGGTIASGQDVTSYTYGVGATLPTDITKDNYIFAGWYKDDRFSGSSVTKISDTDIDNQVFYAKWLSTDAGITAVSVNEKTGIIDGTTITVVLNYGTSTLPTDNSAVSITTADGATVSSLTTTDGSEWKFTVTAEDKKTTEDYTIKVSIAPDPATGNRNDVNAAKSTIENHDWTVPQTTANTEEEVKAWIEGQLANMDLDDASYTVTMTGGSFAAASEGDAADRDGTDGSFAFTVKLSKGTNTGNVATSTYAETTVTISDGTITATPYTKWTITVKAGNGGTVNGGGTFDGNTKITVTATPNSGYHFARWTENGAEVSISASYSFTLTADRTLTAVFERQSSDGSSGGDSGSTTYYTLTFETNGGSAVAKVTGTYGKTIDLSGYAPTCDGYDFSGWYSDKRLTNKITEIKLNGNKTVYAGWTKHNPNTGANPFTDVSTSDWFYDDVMFVYENGLMADTSATTFKPYSNTTHAQIAVIFYRLEGHPVVEGKNNFTDVEYGPGTAWYYDAVTWAQQNGIMAGYGNGKFGPDDPVTREQLASIFYRYAQYKGYDTTQGGMAIREFDDYESISGYAVDAMTWAVNIGIINGKGNNLLDPQGTATRAEIAAMLHRFIEKYNLAPAPVASTTGSGGNGDGTSGWVQRTGSPKTGDKSHMGL